MDDMGFSARLSMETYFRTALPYGGLPSKDSPQMAFFDAASTGDLRRLRELASGKDAEGKAWLADVCIQGGGPFQTAARLGRVDVCRCMVEELGYDINSGSQEVRQSLIQLPHPLTRVFADSGLFLSHYSLRVNDGDSTSYLLSRLLAGITPLAAASMDGRMTVLRYLLDHGADPNKKDNSGFVPLHCAAKKGQAEAARLLLSRGAIVDMHSFHVTPLHFAASYGKAGVMEVLLEHHADPNKVSEDSCIPLAATLHAASEGLPESIALKCVKLLVEAGADVNFNNTETPLTLATIYGLTDCIKYLLKAGADPNIPHSHCGSMPITIAARNGRRKDVELLFPLTSPIRSVSNWTVEGVLAHAKSRHSKPMDEHDDENMKAQLKLCGEKAVKRKDYYDASMFYTEAIELDPTDATLYSNRSLCRLHMTEADKALHDASTCIKLRPEWSKGYYRKGAALMLLKEYKGACGAFMAGLQLDPGNAQMEKVMWEAVDAMKKDHFAKKGLKPSS